MTFTASKSVIRLQNVGLTEPHCLHPGVDKIIPGVLVIDTYLFAVVFAQHLADGRDEVGVARTRTNMHLNHLPCKQKPPGVNEMLAKVPGCK